MYDLHSLDHTYFFKHAQYRTYAFNFIFHFENTNLHLHTPRNSICECLKQVFNLKLN